MERMENKTDRPTDGASPQLGLGRRELLFRKAALEHLMADDLDELLIFVPRRRWLVFLANLCLVAGAAVWLVWG